MEGGEPPVISPSEAMVAIDAPSAARVESTPVAPTTVAAVPSPGSVTIAPPAPGTPSSSISTSIHPSSSPSSTTASSSSLPSSASSSMPTVSTSEQQLQEYQHQHLPHDDHQQEKQQQEELEEPQQQQQPASLYLSPATLIDRRAYYPPTRESRRTFRAEDGKCYFLPKCIHFRPVSSKHAKASLHLQVSAGVYLCNGERCSEKGGNVDFRATPIITKKQVLVFRAFRNLLGWRPIGEPPVALHELLASEVFRLWEKTRRVLDEHAPPISDDEVIRISPPLNKITGGNTVTAPVPTTAPSPASITGASALAVQVPATAPPPSWGVLAPTSGTLPFSGTPVPTPGAPAAPPGSPASVAAEAVPDAVAAAIATTSNGAPFAPTVSTTASSSVELVMKAGELRRVSRDKRRRCNEIYERLLADESVLSGTLEESLTGELPTAADKKAAEKALAAAGSHRRILPAHRLAESGNFGVGVGVSSPMDVVMGGIQGSRGSVGVGVSASMGGAFSPIPYDMKIHGGAASHHGPDIQRSNGPTIGAMSQYGSPSPQHSASNGNGAFLVGGGGGVGTSYRPVLPGRAIFSFGERGGEPGPVETVQRHHACARDIDDNHIHQQQQQQQQQQHLGDHASRPSPHSGAVENGGGSNGMRYTGDSLGVGPVAKRQRTDAGEGTALPDNAASASTVGDGANNNGHVSSSGGTARPGGEAGGGGVGPITVGGGSEDPASAARRQIWFREVQLNDARLQELQERVEREHAKRRSELMSWMVDEEGGKHNGLGPNAGPEPASWNFGA